MKISKTHYELLDITQDNKALTNPQKYLGPNCEEVLRFWNHLDKMSVGQLIEVGEKFSKIDSLNWAKVMSNTYKSCKNLSISFALLVPVIFLLDNPDIPKNLIPDVVAAANIATGEIAANIENPVVLPLFNFG